RALVAVLHGVAECEIWIAPQPARLHDDMLHGQAVHADEAAPKIVERHAELRAAIDVFKIARARIPSNVAGHFQRGFFGMLGRSDRAAGESRGEINPAVRPERRAIDAK